jgi:multicomponent Na+:H+ antiporter subunit E
MALIDHEGHPVHLGRKIFTYFPWLLKEIVKSAWEVSKIILNPRLPLSPGLLRVKTTQRTSVGVVTYANSITLTPGTISVEVGDGTILVHALTQEGAASLLTGDMDGRVTRFEGAA